MTSKRSAGSSRASPRGREALPGSSGPKGTKGKPRDRVQRLRKALLGCLLGVEADDVVGDLGIVGKSGERELVASGLRQQRSSDVMLPRSRQ